MLRAGLAMRFGHRAAPVAPCLARSEAGFDPFGQLGRALQRLASELDQSAVRQPLGQRIDRLADHRRRPLPRLGDLGVDDLPFVAVLLELARHDPLRAFRQAALRPAGIVEIDEADHIPVAVGGEDPHRPAAPAAFARIERSQFEDHVAAEQRGGRGGRLDPLDRAGRQMIEQIDDPGQVEPRQEPGDLRSHALQPLDLREQRIEDVRAHARLLSLRAQRRNPERRSGLPRSLCGLAMTTVST